jgi:hypothetical protein
VLIRDVPKRLSGTNFRHAIEAVAALRHLDPESRARIVPAFDNDHPQRDFQLLVARLVAEGGVQRLAERWRDLPSPNWREMLLSEIGQAFHLWADEGTIEVLIAALDDPESSVARRAVSPLLALLRVQSEKERKELAKTKLGKATLAAWDEAAPWLTAERRARIAAAVTATLDRHADNPKAGLTWPESYIELLGYCATSRDAHAIALLERFRKIAGEPRRSEFEPLDSENLPWPTSILAKKRGIRPGTPFARVWSVPTGLLDIKVLDAALERIRSRNRPADFR